MTTTINFEDGLDRIAALLERLDPAPRIPCTVAGCVHHDDLLAPSHAVAEFRAA